MLKVQEYLKTKVRGYLELAENSYGDLPDINLTCLEELKEDYGIKYNIWNEELVVLNYDQIDSSKYKFDPIVKECRSLVLELGTWIVVSRSFDRFFNQGEDPNCTDKVENLVAYEKVDGSLISLFSYKGEWLYRTKSMIMPDSVINENIDGVTWKEAIEIGLQGCKFDRLNKNWTYILELVCKENRVVVKYDYGKPMLYHLNCRNNETGEYYLGGKGESLDFVNLHGFALPKLYKFDTMDHCLQSAKELRNLEEGYVMLDKYDNPVMKVKNPAYVAAHHLKGNGPLTEKRVLDIILLNEQDEYLSIFPEDKDSFAPYILARGELSLELIGLECATKDKAFDHLTQKEYAMQFKDEPYASIAFKLRQGKTFEEAWEGLTENSKRNMILAYKD